MTFTIFKDDGHFSTQRPHPTQEIHSIVVYRIVNQFVHESLTETLHLAGTVISVCHHGKVRVHTGIPAAVTLYTVSCVIIFDIIALAGRAYKCTGTTCQTWFIKFFPYRRIETFSCNLPVPILPEKDWNMEVFLRWHGSQFFLSSTLLLRPHLLRSSSTAFVRASPFSVRGFPVKLALDHPCCNICSRICTVNAKYLTETAFFRFMTCQVQRWFHALFLLHRRYRPDHLKIRYPELLHPGHRRLSYRIQQSSSPVMPVARW